MNLFTKQKQTDLKNELVVVGRKVGGYIGSFRSTCTHGYI